MGKPYVPLDEWAYRLFVPLYYDKYTQTLWNTDEPDKQEEGWILKSGLWAPWFFNMRPLGDSPELFYNCCQAMADMVSGHDDVDVMISVEMAGINISGGMAVASIVHNKIGHRIGYTRPLPEKVRKPIEAMKLLQSLESDVADYGQKEFVEARLKDGDRVAILDDMATNLGSKIIARQIVLWTAKQKGIKVECNKIFYLLNRNRDNREKGLGFVHEQEPGLYPASLEVNYVIEFDDHLPSLQLIMAPAEYETILNFQKNPKEFQDEDVRKDVLALAAKTRKKQEGGK
jgi:orotate phosphoribosyltransferase